MTRKNRNRFTPEQKKKAVNDYLSGERPAKQIAYDLNTDVQTIYRWKVQREEKAKGIRLEELVDEGNSQEMAQKLLQKEQEIEMYQKKVAEQAVIIDLLKKLPGNENFQQESELTGLIKTTNNSAPKRKRARR